MAENKIVAIDLGSNSIGLTIRNPFEEKQFGKAIVTIFDTGVGKDTTSGQYTVSLAANRTSKRSVRRLYQSRKYKLWTLLETFIHDENNLYCPIKRESLKRWKYYDKEQARKGNGGRQYPINDDAFNKWIKLDFNNDDVPDYISPYQLRHELATFKLNFSIEKNRFKLGRALYHIAQHRGFKSSKIVKNKDDENKNSEQTTDEAAINAIGAEKKKQERFYSEVSKLSFSINQDEDTIGSIFAKIENEGVHHSKRKTEGIRIRKELHQFVTRKMLIKEVKKIFEFQSLNFGSLFKDKKGNPVTYSNSTIFKQQPLRSQKGLVGVCTLENRLLEVKDSKGNIHLKQVGKKRCPVSRPEFEEFRALGLINNISYKKKNDKNAEWEFLSQEKREELYKGKFFVQKDLSLEDIYKYRPLAQWLNEKYGKENWELNYNYKTSVPACSVSTRLQRILGDRWNDVATKKDANGNEIKILHKDNDGIITKEEILKRPFFEDIWHVLFESNDEEFISEYAQKHNLDEKELINLWYAMPVGYAQLSLKAINNILPFLREGFIYTDAVLLAKLPEILGETLWTENKEIITDALKKDVIEKNRNEKKLLNIVNNLIAQYKAKTQAEKFAENKDYVVGSRDAILPEGSKERDSIQILIAIEEGFGKETWKAVTQDEKETIRNQVTQCYQAFFNSSERKFYSLPRLADAMKEFVRTKFENEFSEGEERNKFIERLSKLYHPSMLDIYPKAKEKYYKHGGIEKQLVLLGSPKIGAWKNPMALRTLHELKKLMNYLIATGEIDAETRVVVEVGRELVDTNKRWAYETYQKMREEENKEFAEAIRELIKRENINANPDSDSDLDKFRLWYEMTESPEGYEDKSKKFVSADEDRTYGEVKKKTSKKGKKKEEPENENEEEKYYAFNENHFDKIKKEVWLKLKKAKDNIEERYRLWKEQQCFCIYTNKPIKISDLFNPNLIDVEHTIPRSISFDNSLANKTVCYADYNRNVKKNRIPAELGDDYIGIKQRVEKWQQKVNDLKVRVEFWKGKSKQASTKDYKDICIRQRHLWQFELDYWCNKVERFTMTEIKAGFKNSQLKDTQLISKYAFHYLKSYFNKVDVQKGSVTAEFRKIFNIQQTNTPKDRSKHSHHAKDAIVLSVIPVAAIRDKILEVWYKIDEQKDLLKSNTEKNKTVVEDKIRQLEEELNQLKFQCNLPKGLNNTINKLDDTLLINNIARNRSLLPANKKIKVKGGLKKATGDAIRGQLHKDSFFGAIKLVKKDKNGKWVKNEKGEFEFEPIKYVIREELAYKANAQSPGFKDLNDLEKQIVDKDLFNIIKTQVEEVGDFKDALKRGIWMLDKNGNRVNKIRRVRIELRDKGPVEVKSQTNINITPSKILPDRTYKQKYYAANGENIAYAIYEDIKGNKGFEMLSLFDAAKLKRTISIDNLKDFFPQTKPIGKAKNEGKLIAVLQPSQKVIFYKENINELTELPQEDLNKRLYKIISLYGKTTGQVQFQHHLEARPDKELSVGVSKVNFSNIESRYLLSPSSFDFAIEGKHFEINPDGTMQWKF